MTHQDSYGIIPLRYETEWEVFIIKHRRGHWGFPKGHPEKNEPPEVAAARELKEETGLEVDQFWAAPPLTEHFSFSWHGQRVEKTVTYYIALAQGNVKLQPEEVEDGRWISLYRADDLLSFPEARAVCKQVRKIVATATM